MLSGERLREHDVTLRGERLLLRPMHEDDWESLLVWNNDPAVRFYADANETPDYSLADLQRIYRTVSQQAYCFIAELDGRPIGDCWLQEMNVERVRERYPGLDLRRIDLEIGEKALWGRGFGTEMIGTLVDFGFNVEGVDAIYGLISAVNPRSRRAFEKNGFTLAARRPEVWRGAPSAAIDLVLTRTDYERREDDA